MKTPPKLSVDDAIHNENAINAVVKRVTEELAAKAAKPTEQEEVIRKANAALIEVRETFMRIYNLKVTPLKFDDAVDIIRKMYHEHYKTWTKDELVTFCALKDAVLAAQSLQSELI